MIRLCVFHSYAVTRYCLCVCVVFLAWHLSLVLLLLQIRSVVLRGETGLPFLARHEAITDLSLQNTSWHNALGVCVCAHTRRFYRKRLRASCKLLLLLLLCSSAAATHIAHIMPALSLGIDVEASFRTRSDAQQLVNGWKCSRRSVVIVD